MLCGSLSQRAVGLGAAMHNAAYRALGMTWHYVPFEVTELAPAIAAMRALGIRGLGISAPFKVDVMALCDALDPLAERIGAVNTVVNDAGKLVGHNTDWSGAASALAEAMSLAKSRILVLGAGGAARAVAFGLVEAGAEVTLANRSDARALALAGELGAGYVPWSQRNARGFGALVNATSAVQSPMPDDHLETPVVMDIVYKPLETELLAAARRRGARCIHGGRMLLYQAARQFALYTGRDAPLDAMDDALTAAIG